MNRIGRGSGCYAADGPDRMLNKFDERLTGNVGKLDLKIFDKPALICCQFGVEVCLYSRGDPKDCIHMHFLKHVYGDFAEAQSRNKRECLIV